jgi:hypothetical protein
VREHDKVAEEAMKEVISDATTNALLYGCGFIRISFQKGTLNFACVDREEFRDTADHLIWLDNNARRETKQ